MNKTDLTEYADYLLQTAMYKVQNISDAEDLVHDTLMAALHAIEKGKIIDNPKNWLVTVLNRKYYDKLRQKYRKPTVSIDVMAEVQQEDMAYEELEQSVDAENVRRCLAYLTKLYRDVLVRFYMHGESVRHIAAALDISENTVKSRLDAGRRHIRKEIDVMECYAKQSYEPEDLGMSISGRSGMNGEPFSLVQKDRIAMNLLILAYDKPVTLPELAKAIGISTTYIEPIVNKLVDGELMKRVSDKVYTDFIIYTVEDRTKNLEAERKLADKLYKSIWAVAEDGLNELREEDFYREQGVTKQIKLESFFVVRTVQRAVIDVRDNASGGIQPFEMYPDRPNGGKWYAMGSRNPVNYDWDKNTYHKYYISGEACNSLEDYCGLKKITLCEFDCALGRTHQAYHSSKYLKHTMTRTDVMKMIYAIHSDREEDLPIINLHCFDNISSFEKLNYLRKDDNGKIVADIPVISAKAWWRLNEISDKYRNMISLKFQDEIMKLMRNKVEVPKHLKSVTEWQKYMHCCATFTMLVILKARHEGLFLKEYDPDNYPVPAVFIAVEK